VCRRLYELKEGGDGQDVKGRRIESYSAKAKKFNEGK
jgi:hypothetical protein